MTRGVFDASAVIALLRDEPGAQFLEDFAGESLISAVNLQEVVKAMLVHGYPTKIVQEMLAQLELEVMAHKENDAWAAAELAAATRKKGSGLGDRSCMALAIREGLPAITTDKAWTELDIPGLTVILAR